MSANWVNLSMLILCFFALTLIATDATSSGLLSETEEPDCTYNRIEAISTYVKSSKYMSKSSKKEFIQKIRMIPQSCSLVSTEQCDTLSTSAGFPLLKESNGYAQFCENEASNLLDENTYQLVCPDEAKENADPSVEAIDEAIKIAELTIGTLKDLTTFILTEVDSARDGINKFRDKIEAFTEEELVAYTELVATATITLNNAAVTSKSIYEEMLDLVAITVTELYDQMDEGDAFVEAMKAAQFLMSVALETSAERLKILANDVSNAQKDLKIAGDQSLRLATKIEDNLNNKNGFLDSKIKNIRAAAYGGCAACVVFPPSCAACYAVAAPIVESEVASLRKDLENTKSAMQSIKDQFVNLSGKCFELSSLACNLFGDMTTVSGKLLTTERLITSDSATVWKVAVLPNLVKLQDLLKEALEAQAGKVEQPTLLDMVMKEPRVGGSFFTGEPDCTKFGITPQPYYVQTPGGGNSCACNTTHPGFVYAWSKKGDSNTKIGCAKEQGTTGDAACIKRIKQEITQRDLPFDQVQYQCAKLTKNFVYSRFKYPNLGPYSLTVCNAAEYLLQDYFYCNGRWLGRNGTGKPVGAKDDGRSEWFSVPLSQVKDRMRIEGIIH